MKDILIATCGTSILTNAREIKNEIIGNKNYNEMTEEEAEKLKKRVLEDLRNRDVFDKKCGAELNSTYYIMEKGNFSGNYIYLIVSDSIEGKTSGEIIEILLKEKLNIKNVEIRVIEKLNITKEYEFAKKGLRNLASDVAFLVKKNGYNNVMISPIGGLKAQIFTVGLIAQIFKIPAYYLYENSTTVVELLPLPISLDMNFFQNNIGIISKLYKEEMVSKKEIKSYLYNNSDLRNVLEEEHIDGEDFVALSALGVIAYEKLISDTSSNIPRDATKEEKKEDIQYKKNEAHAEQLRNNSECKRFLETLNSIPYIKKIIINYFNPDNKGDIIRITKSSSNEGKVLQFEFNHKLGMLGGMIFLTENEETKLDASIIDIYQKL